MRRIPSKRQIRHIVLALLLPALMFRAAIPAGYMPTVNAAGQVSVVMCSAVDVTAASTPGNTSGGSTDRHGQENARGSSPCHFAASSALAPIPESGWSSWLDIATDFITRDTAIEVRLPAVVRAQSPRGPPAS